MTKISSFKTFESSNSSDYIDNSFIKDIFIELLDNEYKMESYYNNESELGKYFFEFKKELSESDLNYIEDDSLYGYTNIDIIKNEINNAFIIIEESKSRLESMGYSIAFEFEFNFTISSQISIVCHMQHSNLNKK